MRTSVQVRARVLELDRRYRSSWDVRSIAHVVGISHTTVAKILRDARGPRPKAPRPSHERRTEFLGRDVMWSSDFTELANGRKLLRTMDERSRFRLAWDIADSETAQAVEIHAEDLIARMGRAPLVWKFDHGSAFMSEAFQAVLARHGIIPYPIPARAPWANGRTERDNREIKNWLLGMPNEADLERDIDEGMLMLNYVKPRAVLGYRTSASVYFGANGVEPAQRRRFLESLASAKANSGVWNERLHRQEVRRLLQGSGLYREWDAGRSAESVNR